MLIERQRTPQGIIDVTQKWVSPAITDLDETEVRIVLPRHRRELPKFHCGSGGVRLPNQL